jgi:hypothetical protein
MLVVTLNMPFATYLGDAVKRYPDSYYEIQDGALRVFSCGSAQPRAVFAPGSWFMVEEIEGND